MGEYVGLAIGKYNFLSYKNCFGDLLSIYSKEDLKIESAIDEDGEHFIRRYFSINVGKAKMCLDMMGHTICKAQELFEYYKEEYIEYLLEFDNEKEIENIEREYIFESWVEAVKKYSLVLAFEGDKELEKYKEKYGETYGRKGCVEDRIS